MKKLIKILAALAAVFVVLVAGALITLKIMFPFSKLKTMAQEYVAQNYNREIDFKDVSFNLIGVTVEDFKFSEEGGFKEGDFVSAETAVVKVEFTPLLKKQIKIKTIGFDGVKINVVKLKDGKFNFDSLIPASAEEVSPEPQEEEISSAPLAMDLTAKDIYIKNSDVIYKDLQNGTEFSVKDVNFSIKDFDYNNPFSFMLSLSTTIDTGDIKLSPVTVSSEGTANIAGMDLSKASAEVKTFAVAYKHFKVDMAGGVENFEQPKASLKGTIKGVDSKLAAEFVSAEMPVFSLPVINIEAEAAADLNASKAEVSKFNVGLGKSYVNTSASADFSKPELSFSAATKINVNLSDVSDIAKDMLAEFKLKGLITGNIKTASASPAPSVKGSIVFKDLGASVMGKILSALNGTVTINSINDVKTNVITGVFDNSDFKTSLAYSNKNKMAVDFMFNMDKFTLDDIDFNKLMASSEEEKPQASADKAEAQTSSSDLKMDPMDIKADVIIKRVENNVFSTDNLTFKANIKNLDLTMAKASGTMSFSASDGEIRDLDKIINSSVFLKVIFTTVKIAQKALKATQVISGGSINTDSVSYKSIVGDYTLGGGVAKINKSDLNSDLATITTTGTVNFVTEKLDMKIKVGLGKNASGSAAIKVGGTVNDPSFKLDVASTVSSLLGGGKDSAASQTVQDVKNTVKDITGGIKNLFKKK